jgi:hypothetical protein
VLLSFESGEAVGAPLVAGPVDLTHSRIVADQYPGAARILIEYSLGDGLQVGDGDHPYPGTEGQTLGNGGAQADAGEGTGAAAEGDGVQVLKRDARLSQQVVNHLQDAVGVAALGFNLEGLHARIGQQSGGAILCRGVQGEELHL